MSVLKIVSSSAEELFVIIIATEYEVISVMKKGKLNKSISLLNNQQYKLLYLDLEHHLIYSVSFLPKDFPNSTFTLPLYQSMQSNTFTIPDQSQPTRTLIVEHKFYTVGLSDSRASLHICYSIDDEPLIEIKTQSSNSDTKNQSIISDALNAKIENYLFIIEHERKMREAAEEKSREVLVTYDRYLKNAHEKEEKFKTEANAKDEQINALSKEVNELRVISDKYAFEVSTLKENYEFRILAVRNCSFNEELEQYKKQLEISDQKWQKLINQLEESDENYPLHYLLKEKEQEVAELNKRVKELSEKPFEADINKFLSDSNIKYHKENDLVYRVSGVKFVVVQINHEFVFHGLGRSLTLEEIGSKRPHNRSISDIKTETPRSAVNKSFAGMKKKPLASHFLSKKST